MLKFNILLNLFSTDVSKRQNISHFAISILRRQDINYFAIKYQRNKILVILL